jgi:hypothetical protein
MITELSEQLCPCGMPQVIAVQSIGKLIDFGQCRRWAAEMAKRQRD